MMKSIQYSRLTNAAPKPIHSQPPPTGLYAKWEMVDGRLTCIWLKHPD